MSRRLVGFALGRVTGQAVAVGEPAVDSGPDLLFEERSGHVHRTAPDEVAEQRFSFDAHDGAAGSVAYVAGRWTHLRAEAAVLGAGDDFIAALELGPGRSQRWVRQRSVGGEQHPSAFVEEPAF